MGKTEKKLHKLRYWREVLGLKQDAMATLLGCTTSNYCIKEAGKTEIKLSEMLLIQKTFNAMREKVKESALTLDDIFLP